MGTLVLFITGVAGLMRALHESVSQGDLPTQAIQFGYGPYGGNKENF